MTIGVTARRTQPAVMHAGLAMVVEAPWPPLRRYRVRTTHGRAKGVDPPRHAGLAHTCLGPHPSPHPQRDRWGSKSAPKPNSSPNCENWSPGDLVRSITAATGETVHPPNLDRYPA
jgi:hypothetical protein